MKMQCRKQEKKFQKAKKKINMKWQCSKKAAPNYSNFDKVIYKRPHKVPPKNHPQAATTAALLSSRWGCHVLKIYSMFV